MLFLPFLISFFFQTSIHLTTGFLFPFSSVFLRFSHFFLFDYCVPKKVTKWYKKEKGLSNDVSLTITFLLLHIHSIGRGGKVGFIFVLFWESLWVKLLQRLEKKKTSKMTHLWVTFFSWSHDVVRCCGNCPKYSFCFFVFFEVQSFMVKASFIFIARRTFFCL